MFLPKQSGMWKRHYLIPEYIPAKGRQEVCWKTSCTECEADKNHFSLMSCIQDSCQLEQILLEKCNCSFFFSVSFVAFLANRRGERVRNRKLSSTGSHSAEKCSLNYIIIVIK